MNKLTTEQKISHYITLRDHKQQADKDFKASMTRVNEAMAKLEAELLEEMAERGTTSEVCKGVGTAYIRTVSSMKTTDRNEFLKWALGNKELDAMDIRPNKTIINEKLEKGEFIPGIKVTQTNLIGVRKGK